MAGTSAAQMELRTAAEKAAESVVLTADWTDSHWADLSAAQWAAALALAMDVQTVGPMVERTEPSTVCLLIAQWAVLKAGLMACCWAEMKAA